MCETADWGGVILGQSIDKTSCRGQRFSHLYSHYDGKTCREPWWHYKTQRKPAQITTKTRLHLTKTANLFPHEFPICYNLLSQVITEETIVYSSYTNLYYIDISTQLVTFTLHVYFLTSQWEVEGTVVELQATKSKVWVQILVCVGEKRPQKIPSMFVATNPDILWC